jgi:hypothetical protein
MLPLLLMGGASLLGGLSLIPGASDAAGDAVSTAVEASVAVIGPALVKTVTGTYEAVRDESKGHGVEIATAVTVIVLIWAGFLAAKSVLEN